ncbi:MAG TPA: copper resistance protein NlpE N-terminal domain-containing protein [Anaerolineae bacterium]|nr:copper resistance protein NlpE N-terminal domain-containing protein [Anaerolineae bacterium]
MRFLFIVGVIVMLGILVACGSGNQGGVVPPPAPTVRAPTSATVTPPASATVKPTTVPVVTATAEPATTAGATAVPQTAIASAAQPGATAIPAAPVPAGSKLVGSYSGVLPAADAPGRIVSLELAIDGTATMTTQFIGKGAPSTESGTWVANGNEAEVTFTQVDGTPEDNRITWKLDGNQLTTTEYDTAQYGSAGLPLTRVGTGDIVEANLSDVSFSFDSTLAPSAKGTLLAPKPVENAPALGGGAPAGVQFVFGDAKLPADYFDPHLPQVYVYPVDGLKKLDSSVAKGVESLQALLNEKPTNPQGDIFVVPLIPSAQGMRTQVRYLDFVNGSGVRFVTYYSQDISPVTNDRVFYTFQGITLDGKWYVSVFWPVTTPALPNGDNAPDTSHYNAKQFEEYLNAIIDVLNNLPPAGFVPNLTLLDNMSQSLNVSPLLPTPTP